MSRRILVVDEKPEHRGLLRIVLTDDGYEVVTATTAGEAMEVAETEPIDAVLMDFFLPDRNGIELALQLRRIRKLAGIPVLMLSAEQDSGLRILGERAGISQWLGKPLPPELLLDILRPMMRAAGS